MQIERMAAMDFSRRVLSGAWMLGWLAVMAGGQGVPVDVSGHSAECGVTVRVEGERLDVAWPMGDGAFGRVRFDLVAGRPLIGSMGIGSAADGAFDVLVRGVEPVTFLTVGSRVAPPGRPPAMSPWNVFFDKPASRAHERHVSTLDLERVRVTSAGRRATVTAGDVAIGPFTGELQFTFYAGSRLVHVEAIVTTELDGRAILYDAGLVGASPGWTGFAWMDTEGAWQRVAGADVDHRPLAVRHRAVMVECDHGAVACFPPPHQFHFPRDWTDNLKFAWIGADPLDASKRPGFGVRQVPDGGRAFEPWFNAPPGTKQRLGVFYLLARGKAEDALRETLRYTRDDRFPKLKDHITFTSHYHMAVAVDAMARDFKGTPDFVRVFRDMGVDAVHIADFHGDGHPKDFGPLRLREMDAMFRECRRLSDDEFLLIPGEEINEFLGLPAPGRHPGHWMSLFPKPVFWVQKRADGVPFIESHPEYGRVYRVGSRTDMVHLLERELGLAWVAHPRIKASSWTPDVFRNEDFYLSDIWLGGAWKAMPADLSRERLGERGLDLLDDMANWGQRKYLPGEVDVFKIDHTHELYGHMNVNYLRLDRLPRFEDGWQPILDALSSGQFFVTTGEILLREFTVGGKASGGSLSAADAAAPELRAVIDWTFPLRFAEVISGDGQRVFRERIDLNDTTALATRPLVLKPNVKGRKWVRFEVWDVAANGAVTQPVWIKSE